MHLKAFPSPIVTGLRGIPISSTPPTNGQVLTYVSIHNDWEPGAGGGGGGGTLGGDVSGPALTNTVISISGSSPIPITPANLQWITGTSSPLLSQANITTNGATGQALKVQAQNATGTTSTGGGLTLTTGTGTTAAGNILLQTGGTTKLTVSPTNITSASSTTITVSAFSSAGIVHNDSSGNLSSSLIVDADVTSVGVAKLIAGTSAQLLLNNSTPTPTWTTVSGDITISSTGSTTLNSISGSSPIAITPANLQWATATSSPLLSQADNTTNSAIAQTLTVQAQNATGTTANGGALAFKAGTGTTAGGAITFNTAATTSLTEAGRITASGKWQFGTNSNQATSGSINFQNNTSILAFRNAANSADVIAFASNNANDLGVGGTLGHASQCRVVQLNCTLAIQGFVSSTQTLGMQIASTDFISLGLNASNSGTIRMSNGTTQGVWFRNAANNGDIAAVTLDSSNNLNLGNGNPLPVSIQTGTATVQWVNTVSSPTLKQADNTTNSATATNLTIQAQNATGTTAIGGNLVLTSGTGTSTNGNVNIQAGGTTKLSITPSALNIVGNESDWDNAATFNVLATKGNATSTDATTAQTLITYTPPNNSAHSLEVTVVGYNTANNNDCYKAQFTLTVVTTSNTPVIVGVNSPINVQTNGSGSTYVGPTVAVSGATITITTKGAASTTVDWIATAQRTQVS